MKQQLEQMLECTSKIQNNKNKTIDIYATNALALYTYPCNNVEIQTTLHDYNVLSIEGPGSILRTSYELDEGWKLQERFDFSEHNNTTPHINYDIMNPVGSIQPKTSTKYLDNNHQVDLWK